MEALNNRFERPEAKNRWDSFLFTIRDESDLAMEQIADVLFKTKAPPPNKSTINVIF